MTASRLSAHDVRIPGEHMSGEYCHIASVSMFEHAGANYSILFTGYGFHGFPDAPWSGMLYFEWNAQSINDISASAKWVCLTREDLSDRILLTVEDAGDDEKILHIWFAYVDTYASANVTLIKGSNVNFDIYTNTHLIWPTIATSTFSSSSNYFKYGVDIPRGAWTGQFDLSSGENFILECDDTIEMGPRQNGDGVYVKLATEYKRKISSLETTVSTLVAENQKQAQQIADLKSVLNEIITGKTWDSSIWS